MSTFKNGRITSDIKNALSILLRDIKDPRVSKLLSIVKVTVSGDLSYATIYVSAIEGYEKTKQSVEGLKSAGGFLRRELGHALKLRKVPELKFIADDSLIKSAEIMQTLKDIGLKENIDKRPEEGKKEDINEDINKETEDEQE